MLRFDPNSIEGITYFNGKQQFYSYEFSKEKIREILRKLSEEGE